MDDNGSILIDQDSRRALAAFLRDQSAERPPTIPEQEWRMLIHAEMSAISYDLLSELMDEVTPAILDILRWPDASNWTFPTGPAEAPRYLKGHTL